MDPFISVGLVCVAVTVANEIRKRSKRPTTHGSARWADLRHAVHRRIIPITSRGILLGDLMRFAYLPVRYRGEGSIVTFAPSGSGKGVGMSIPTLLECKFGFAFDPEGENSAVAAKVWRERDYRFYCINPFKMHAMNPWALPSHSFNLFDRLDPSSDKFTSAAAVLAGMIVHRTGHESEPFFINKAEAYIKSILMHIRADQHSDTHTLAQVREYITAGRDGFRKLIQEMRKSQVIAVRNTGNELDMMFADGKQDSRTLSSILASMSDATSWMDDPIFREATSDSEVRFEDLKSLDENGKPLKGVIITCILPNSVKDAYSPFVRLVLGCVLLTLQESPLALSRVLIQIEEAGSLGHVKAIENTLPEIRKFRGQFHIVYQSIAQPQAAYGKSFNTVMDCFAVQQYTAPNNPETEEYVSKKCGMATVETQTVQSDGRSSRITKSLTGRRLIMPDEVGKMRPDQQIVFMNHGRPILMKLRPYFERPSMRGMFYRNPLYKTIKPLPFTWPLQMAAGMGLRVSGWVIGPSRTFAAVVLAMAAAYAGGAAICVSSEPAGERTFCTYHRLDGTESWTFPGRCSLVRFNGQFFG